MRRSPRVRRSRPALPLALAMAALSGCVTQQTPVRAPVASDASASDLLDLAMSSPPGFDPSPLDRTGPADPSPVSASMDPARGPRSLDINRTPVNLDGGLMGPTPPISATAAATPPTIPRATPAGQIDLTSALRLADGQNPTIGEARILILGALAERQAARALLLPYLNAGTSYHDHTGPLQRSTGSILPVTQQNLYVGGGAGVTGSSTVAIPAVNISSPLTDAIFEPLAAQQRVVGARFNASDAANKVLLDVASLFLELIGAEAALEARRVTAAESDRIAASVAAFAATGQGRKSDAERAEADRRLFQADIQQAEERVAVASARLAQQLNLDPSSQLSPVAGILEPIELIDPEISAADLIRDAVTRRPDLAAREALVASAGYQVRKEKARPLLPTVWLGFSGAGFGGGSNLVPGTLSAFSGRTDFDVRAYWTLLNLGAGNASLIKGRKAQQGQAMAERARVLSQVREDVTSARAEALALRSQVAIARGALRTAEDGYRQDQQRLRESLSLPIEALDSLRLLSDARILMIRAITRANQAQFALFVSLGAPPPLEPAPALPGP